MPRDIVVIGAGIVGVAAAALLQRDGHRVTLLDSGAPGGGASSGSAGCFSPGSIVEPVAGRGARLRPRAPRAHGRAEHRAVVAPLMVGQAPFKVLRDSS